MGTLRDTLFGQIKSTKINLGTPPSPKYQNEKVFFSGMGSLNQSLHVVLTNRTILSLPCLLTQHCDFHRICQKEMLAANIEDADLSNASEGKLWALDQIQGSEISLNAFFLHFEAVFRGKIGVAFHFIIELSIYMNIEYPETNFQSIEVFLGYFCLGKEKQRIFQLHQLIGRDQIKRWQNISGFFANICHF